MRSEHGDAVRAVALCAARHRWAVVPLALVGLLGGLWGWVGWAFPLSAHPSVTGPTIRLEAGREEIAVLPGLSRRDEQWRTLSYFPRPLVEAVLIAEDRRFFRHGGIDPLAVLRAAAVNLQQDRIRQGGSTITQQVARTLFLTGERTWGRKLREAALALLLEFRYSKSQILEAYLNTVYLGQDGGVAIYGFPAAVQRFLAKDLITIRPDEAALLAAAINSPNRALADASGRTRTVRDTILQALAKRGVIDAAAAREAMARPARLAAGIGHIRAPYFVDLVREEISRRLLLPAAGEIHIDTSLDPALQRVAERAVEAGVRRIEARLDHGNREKVEAALVALDPTTGRIRALVGGRGYPWSPFNRATHALRQPGSLFKPFVYLTAFESGGRGGSFPVTPASMISDEPLTIRDGDQVWTPKNIDHQFRGGVTVRRAIEESRNVPAVRVAQEVGLARIVAVARQLGIASPLAAVPSLALGTSEVTLLEITRAFAALANGGIRVVPTVFAADDAPPGTTFAAPLAAPERVVTAESAFLVTHLLRGVMREGTGRASARWGVSEMTAGKTGSSDRLRDAWFVGYTPDLVVGVWVGRDDGSPLGLTGAQAALPIWADTMAAAVRQKPPRPFTAPAGVVFVSVDRATGMPASCSSKNAVEEAFRVGTEPQAGCVGTRLAQSSQGILDWFRGLFR